MGTLVLALTLGILARSWLSPRIKLPYTSVVLMLGTCLHCRVPLPFIQEESGRPRQPIYVDIKQHSGLVFGFIMHTEEGITGPDIFSRSVNLWINLSPEAILTGVFALSESHAYVYILYVRGGTEAAGANAQPHRSQTK